jgi:hypothetical protein
MESEGDVCYLCEYYYQDDVFAGECWCYQSWTDNNDVDVCTTQGRGVRR